MKKRDVAIIAFAQGSQEHKRFKLRKCDLKIIAFALRSQDPKANHEEEMRFEAHYVRAREQRTQGDLL